MTIWVWSKLILLSAVKIIPSALFVLLSVCCLAARGSRALAIDSSTPRAENEADWPADAINLFCRCGKRKNLLSLKVKSGSAYYTQLSIKLMKFNDGINVKRQGFAALFRKGGGEWNDKCVRVRGAEWSVDLLRKKVQNWRMKFTSGVHHAGLKVIFRKRDAVSLQGKRATSLVTL